MSLYAHISALAARATRWAYRPFPPIDDGGRDPYRWCVWCGCDCDADPIEHRHDCPAETGLRPVTAQQLGMRGPHDPYAHGMGCMDCGALFKLGDIYALRPYGGDGDAFEVVCVGCRVLNPEAAST